MSPRSTLLSALAALLLAPALAFAQDEDKDKDKDEAKESAHPTGMYTYVKGMRGDTEIPKEHLEGSKVEIEEGELALLSPEGKEEFEITYTIDDDSDPQAVKFSMEIVEAEMQEAVGSKAKGLAKMEGDTITLIYDYGDGADYPDDFEPDGDTQHLFVIKKTGEIDDDDDGDDDDDDGDDDDDDDGDDDGDDEDDPR